MKTVRFSCLVLVNRTRLFLLILTLLYSGGLLAGNPITPVWSGTIQLKKDVYTLKEVMIAFAKETGFKIAYDTKRVSPGTKIKITYSKISPKQLLKIIKQQTGISYRAKKSYVILLPRFKQRIFKTKRIIEIEFPLPEKSISAENKSKSIDSILPAMVTATTITDTLVAKSLPDSILGPDSVWTTNFYQFYSTLVPTVYYESVMHLIHGLPIRPEKMNSSYLREQAILEVGITNNEIFYVAPVLNAGLKFLYGSACAFNYKGSFSWRLGIGTSYQLSKRWQLRASYSWGNTVKNQNTFVNSYSTIEPLPKDSSGNSPGDTILYFSDSYPIGVSSQWNAYALTARYYVGRNFCIVAGATYNLLKSKYTFRGVSGDEYTGNPIIPIGAVPETMNTPFAGKEKTSANPFASNTKKWLGFQLTILYSF